MLRVIVLAVCVAIPAGLAWADITIRGKVRDEQGRPLSATIEIEALVKDNTTGRTTAHPAPVKPDGSYEVLVPLQAPNQSILAVTYNGAALLPRNVQGISSQAGDDDVINMLMVPVFGTTRQLALPQQLAEYQSALAIEQSRAPPGANGEQMIANFQKKYAAKLLALPDPDREEQFTSRQKEALNRVPDAPRETLSDQLDGLFNLCDLNTSRQLIPGKWKTTFDSPMGPVESDVTLFGPSGEYVNRRTGTKGRLENVEVQEDEENNRLVISGQWLLGGAEGTFRWESSLDDPENFKGTSKRKGSNETGKWDGQHVPPDMQ